MIFDGFVKLIDHRSFFGDDPPTVEAVSSRLRGRGFETFFQKTVFSLLRDLNVFAFVWRVFAAHKTRTSFPRKVIFCTRTKWQNDKMTKIRKPRIEIAQVSS